MGRATKWFRGLFGLKKSDPALSATTKLSKEKRRWSFVKSYREKDNHHNHVSGPINDSVNVLDLCDEAEESQQTTFSDGVIDPNKRAIAVAAATAAVAQAAVVAAQAAAAVVRLTNSGRCASNPMAYVSGNCVGVREECAAAIRIQAAFRGCLARRALRALKGLVRLQALVRGHIERKRTAEWLRRMQALLQAQKIARAMRSQVSDSSNSNSKSSQFHQPGPETPEKFEHAIRSKSMKHDQSSLVRKSGSKAICRNISYQDKAHSGLSQSDGWLDEKSADQLCSSSKHTPSVNEKSDIIVEMDTIKSRRRNLFHNKNNGMTSDQSFSTSKDSANNHQTDPSPPSCEVQSPSLLRLVGHEIEENSFWTTHSPQFYSASLRCDGTRKSPFTPTKSDGSRSFLSGYSDYPNYMAYTESSKAKVRSLSVPKQRPQYERSSSAKRCSIGSVESKLSGQKMYTLHENFTNKAYPGSGRLDNMGMPVGYTY